MTLLVWSAYQKIVFLIQNNVNTIQDLNINIELIDDKNRIGLDYYNEIIFTITLQYLAYNLSISKGINPDKPRNLAKSVTVE